MSKMSPEEVRKTFEEYQKLNKELQKSRKSLINLGDYERARAITVEIIANNEKIVNQLKNNTKGLTDEQLKQYNKLIDVQKELNNELDNEYKRRKHIISSLKHSFDLLVSGYKYLQQQDKIIKNTILNLGMSGNKAELMRGSFERSAMFVARLGGNLEVIQTMMTGFADETGRSRALTSDMVKDITVIGKGTGLGIEQATKLSAQFEAIGINTKGALDYVQGVVDTSERMGVNTTKVLKNITDNFKKLQTFHFQQGVRGFREMAEYAEKFKVDISDALNSAEIARTLEGAIGMVANLQVMGGEFAKLDMFETLYFARNDPAKLQAKIGEMTKGIVTLRKNSDGTFEKFISPADRDRLAAAGKALGITTDKMTEMALRAFDIGKMSQELSGMGLTNEQKQLIEGAAFFNQQTGKFQVQLGEDMKNISELTIQQAKSFAQEQKLLKDRAKEAMTFDETFKATIEMLKAGLLPLLNNINKALLWISKYSDKLFEGKGIVIAATTLFAGAKLFFLSSKLLNRAFDNYISYNKLSFRNLAATNSGGLSSLSSKSVGIGDSLTPTTGKGSSGLADMRRGIGAGAEAKGIGMKRLGTGIGAGAEAKGIGMKRLGTGAGIGAAALGIGGGVALAAVGISKLADSMSKLDEKQLSVLKGIAMTLAISFPAAALGIAIAGAAGKLAAPGLYALSVAALGIGAAVGIAAVGIGIMAKGIGEMIEKSKGAGDAMLSVGLGVSALSLAMMGFTAGALGLGVFALTMKTIAKHADAVEKVGNAFGNIKAVMSGTKEDFEAVESAVKLISSVNTNKGSVFAELAALLKTPLKVEFEKNTIPIQTDVTLEVDGEKLMNKSFTNRIAVQKSNDAKLGKVN